MLGRNDVFGELGIINGCRRNATIITRYPVEMLVFNDEVSIRLTSVFTRECLLASLRFATRTSSQKNLTMIGGAKTANTRFLSSLTSGKLI